MADKKTLQDRQVIAINDLENSLKVDGKLSPENEKLIERTKKHLSEGLSTHATGAKAEYLGQDAITEMAKGIHAELINPAHGHKDFADKAIKDVMGANVTKHAEEGLQKRYDEVAALHTENGSAFRSGDRASTVLEASYAEAGADALLKKGADASFEARHAILEKVAKNAEEEKRLTESVGADAIKDMHTAAKSYVEGDLAKAIEARHTHTVTKAKYSAEGKKPTEDQIKEIKELEEKAKKAEEEAAKGYTNLRKDMKDDHLKAHDRVIQNAIEEGHAAHPEMHQQLKHLRGEKVDLSKLGEVGKKLDHDHLSAFAGVETAFSKTMGAVAGGAGGEMGKVAKVALAATAAGATYAAAKTWGSSKPETDDKGNETKKGSVFKKVASVALLATAVGLGVAAYKGENPIETAKGAASWVAKMAGRGSNSTGASRA